MNNVVKKVAILSMVGMMQVGLGASAIEASPLHNDSAPLQQQYDRDQGRHEENRFEHERHERERFEHERHERERVENERYENERQNMKRHFFETYSHFHERQRQATERHEKTLEEIRHDHRR